MKELRFLVAQMTLSGLLRALFMWDALPVRVLHYLGKDGINNWFADIIRKDYPYYKNFIGTNSQTRCVDVGCGSGHTALLICQETGVRMVGIDVTTRVFNPEIESLGKSLENFELMTYPVGENLPFSDSTVDVCSLFYVLHHCNSENGNREQALKLLKETKRILIPGGWLLIIEEPISSEKERKMKNKMDMYANALFHNKAVGICHLYYEPELINQFCSVGFKESEIQKIKLPDWSWLLPRTLYVLKNI